MLCQGCQFARHTIRWMIFTLYLIKLSLTFVLDSIVTLNPLPGLSTPTPLTKSKQALSIATFTGVVHTDADDKGTLSPDDAVKAKDVPSVVTHLAIGCKRKIVIYTWKDGEPQEPQVRRVDPTKRPGLIMYSRLQETTLSHSPRAMSFLSEDVICFGYAVSDYALYYLKTSTMVEIATPIPAVTSGAAISSMGMGALSNLGGYMGLGARARPWVVTVHEGEALISRDSEILIYVRGAISDWRRQRTVCWPGR